MAYIDKYGVEYTNDKKALVRCPEDFSGEYIIPDSVTSIGEQAFFACKGLTSVTIPNSVTSIGERAFLLSGLISVTIGNSVNSIGKLAFNECSRLDSIIVENGNTKYDSRENCNAIIETATNTLVVGCKYTVIPDSVISIGDDAFSGCSGLTSINIPDCVTSIGARAFGYSDLTSMAIGNSVTSIGECAFSGCSGLAYVTIGDSVISIGELAFRECWRLTSIIIPSSVTSIGECAFSGCSGLTSIRVEDGNTTYDSRNNCNAIIRTATNTLILGCMDTIIPGSVMNIGEHAFQYCSGLTSITVPNSVISIGDWAFNTCDNLTSITIGNSVSSIGEFAFSDCPKLSSVVCYAPIPPTLKENVFRGVVYSKVPLHVPTGSISNYAKRDKWKDFLINAIAD